MPGHDGDPQTVQVDDFPVASDGNNEHFTSHAMLPQEIGLQQEPHDEVWVANPPGSSRRSGVDYSVVRRSLSTRDDPPSDPSLSSSGLSGGAIGGIIACASLSIMVMLLGVFIWRRRVKNHGRPTSIDCSEPDIETAGCKDTFGTGPVVPHTPSLPALPPLRIPSPSNSVMVSVSPIDSDSDGHDEGGRVFPFSSTDSRTRLVPPQSKGGPTKTDRGVVEIELATVRVRPSTAVSQGRREMKREQVSSMLYPPVMVDGDGNGWRQSMRPLPRPRVTTYETLQYRSSLPDLRNVRMHVEGRLQDFGPVPDSCFAISDSTTQSGHHDDDLLPPDYDQATQPFPVNSMSGCVQPKSPSPDVYGP